MSQRLWRCSCNRDHFVELYSPGYLRELFSAGWVKDYQHHPLNVVIHDFERSPQSLGERLRVAMRIITEGYCSHTVVDLDPEDAREFAKVLLEGAAQTEKIREENSAYERQYVIERFSPVQPLPDGTVDSLNPTLVWRYDGWSPMYCEIQVSKSREFSMNPLMPLSFEPPNSLYWQLVYVAEPKNVVTEFGVKHTVCEFEYRIPDDHPLEHGVLYWWRVRERRKDNDLFNEPLGAWSEEWSFNTS